MYQFLDQYVERINSLLHLIHACRSLYLNDFLSAPMNNTSVFFARDLLNYARIMAVYPRQIKGLQHEDPVIWKSLKEIAFVVAKTGVTFTPLFTEQALEQEIGAYKN